MTKAEQITKQLTQVLPEYCENFILIGFTVPEGEPIMILQSKDAVHDIAMTSMLGGIVANGGITTLKTQMELQAKMRKAAEDQQSGNENGSAPGIEGSP